MGVIAPPASGPEGRFSPLLPSETGNKSWEEKDSEGQLIMGKVLASLRDDAENESLRCRHGSARWRSAWHERETWDKRRWAFERCGSVRPVELVCEDGHEWRYRPQTCGYRFCRYCRKADRGRKRASLVDRFSRWRNPLRMATLTIRNRPAGELEEGLRELDNAWLKLQASPAWREHVLGGVAVLELTGSDGHGWHPHLHVVWDGGFLNQDMLWRAWSDALGYEAALPDLRSKDWSADGFRKTSSQRAADYLAKYASKGVKVLFTGPDGELVYDKHDKPMEAELAALPFEMLREWMAAWWKRRTVRPFGIHLGLPDTLEPREPWDGTLRCPCCQKPAVLTKEALDLYEYLGHERERWKRRQAELKAKRRAELRRRGLEEVPF